MRHLDRAILAGIIACHILALATVIRMAHAFIQWGRRNEL